MKTLENPDPLKTLENLDPLESLESKSLVQPYVITEQIRKSQVKTECAESTHIKKKEAQAMLEGFKPLSDKIKKKPNKAIVSTNGRISLPKEILETEPHQHLSKARCDILINDDTSEVALKIYRSYRIKDSYNKPKEQEELDDKLEGDYNIHSGVVSISAALTERGIKIQESFSADVRQEGEYYIISLAPNLDLKKVKDMLTSNKILKLK